MLEKSASQTNSSFLKISAWRRRWCAAGDGEGGALCWYGGGWPQDGKARKKSLGGYRDWSQGQVQRRQVQTQLVNKDRLRFTSLKKDRRHDMAQHSLHPLFTKHYVSELIMRNLDHAALRW